ncbi:MAG: YmdB family metallophosphoesterase [Spirochaetales bacterium]|jgi:metallophosphoesterase (TIGR00282 family)|nr:YmdB family metallophosphoesterase [Spirochaetales bacterium]
MRILFIGDIVGKAGIFCVKSALKGIVKEKQIDFVIANADGATGGFGLGKNHSAYLRKMGIDVLTGGECIYYKKDMVPHIGLAPYILRPANYPHGNPGRGWRVYQAGDKKIAVICLLGQSGYTRVHLSNPYTFLPEIVSRIRQDTQTIILDYHACTTAEKYAMFYVADGLVSAVAGTHGRVLTADAQVFPRGTAVICGCGRTGSLNSVGGLDKEIEIRKFLTQIPERSKDAWDNLELQGVIFDINEDGRAAGIETLRRPVTEVPHDGDRQSNED